MPVVGFKDYKNKKYIARKGIGKISNFIWKTVIGVGIIFLIIYIIKWTKPWREAMHEPTADQMTPLKD